MSEQRSEPKAHGTQTTVSMTMTAVAGAAQTSTRCWRLFRDHCLSSPQHPQEGAVMTPHLLGPIDDQGLAQGHRAAPRLPVHRAGWAPPRRVITRTRTPSVKGAGVLSQSHPALACAVVYPQGALDAKCFSHMGSPSSRPPKALGLTSFYR